MTIDNYLYPPHPARIIITGPGECGKSVFLTNSFLFIFKEYDKKTSIYQVFNKNYITT